MFKEPVPKINDDYAAYLGLSLQKSPGGNTDVKGAVNLSHSLWTGFSHFANSSTPQDRCLADSPDFAPPQFIAQQEFDFENDLEWGAA